MSRLPGPGFSRLKAPGFTKNSSVVAASQVPLPDDTVDEETVQKPPQPPPSQIRQLSSQLREPSSQLRETSSQLREPSTQLRQPSSQLRQPSSQIVQPRGIPTASNLRPPKKTNILKIPKGQNFSNTHSPSPYERSKPQSSHIPYVGKKKTKGTLKAPESRSTVIPKNNIITKLASNNVIEDQTKSKETKDENVAVNETFVKPVKRQLIPSKYASAPSVSGIVRPASSSGIAQPRVNKGPPRVNSPISKSRGISRSLQTLPQAKNAASQKITKSSSSDNLSRTAKNIQKTNVAKQNGLSKLGKPPNNFRPRASSHNPANKLVNVISTPCQPGLNKQLNKLKISPIANNGAPSQDTTFDQSNVTVDLRNVTVDRTQDGSNSSFDVISNESIENANQVPLDGNSLNITYNKVNLTNPNRTLPVFKDDQISKDTTTVIPDAVAADNNNYLKDLNQTHVISNDTVSKIEHLPNEKRNLTSNLLDPDMDGSQLLNQTHVIQPNLLQQMATSVKAKIKEDNNDVFNDSDFLEHQAMPYCEETPLKGTDTLQESLDNNSSFTDDILKVIAAISSNMNTQAEPSVVMTTSPIKQHKEDVVLLTSHNEIVKQENIDLSQTDLSKSHVISEASTIRNNDTFNSSQLAELELDIISRPKSMSITEYPISPTTPRKNSEEEEDNFFSIANRCYTVSAAELRKSKISRRNTFQAHDSSRFRVPKEINMHETLEGNILMDNTSFLQLSNDTRAMKTMLLKLKRTLLEVDCPSPLVKSPLKRSNSCSVRRSGDPPLSPRTSISSPMAVVDPFSPTENEDADTLFNDSKKNPEDKAPERMESVTSLTEKFQDSLRRIEELEKEVECNKYTIKLLQTQLETTEQTEQDMLEENIILREEVNHLNERLQKLTRGTSRERTLTASGSYKDEFDLADTQSRKGILQRMYSNDANQE